MTDYFLLKGVDKLYYALVTQDDASAYAAGTPAVLAPLKLAVQSPKINTKTDYYDNQPMFSLTGEGETKIKLDVTQLPLSVQAALLGKEYDATNESLYDSGGTAPYIALGFRAKQSDGTFKYFWYLKGTCAPYEEEANTETDSPEPKGVSIEYTAVQTVHEWALSASVTDSIKRRVSTKAADGATWFDSVQVPEYSAPSALTCTPSPADGATGQSTSVAITLTFNNPIMGGTPENGVSLARVSTLAPITVTRSWNAARTVLTLAHSALNAGQQYIIVVNGIKDTFGQSLADAVYDFTCT